MKRGVLFACIVVLVCVVAGMVSTEFSLLRTGAAAAPPAAQSSVPTNAASKEACLNCHGPFDKLVANVNYQAPSGERISPHRYVPHSAKEAKAIPECSNCHEPHPVPAASNVATLSKPDVQWCYTTCHHKNTFQPCKDCHK
jgi:hypothetical protein